MLAVRRLQRKGDALGCARELMRVGALTEQIAKEEEMKVNRSAVSGKFVSAEDAAADPDRHVAQTVREPFSVSIVDISPHFTKLNLHGTGLSVHRFTGADGPDSDPHDHPFGMDIEILRGGYVEQVFDLARPHDPPQEIERREGDKFRNESGTIHRILWLTAPETWTVLRLGPVEREWGSYQFRPDGVWHRVGAQGDWRPLTQSDASPAGSNTSQSC